MKTLLEKVKSSNIEMVGYDKEVAVLYIRFKGGGLYSYYPFKASTFQRLKKADSKGKFFHKHIKDNPRLTVQRLE